MLALGTWADDLNGGNNCTDLITQLRKQTCSSYLLPSEDFHRRASTIGKVKQAAAKWNDLDSILRCKDRDGDMDAQIETWFKDHHLDTTVDENGQDT